MTFAIYIFNKIKPPNSCDFNVEQTLFAGTNRINGFYTPRSFSKNIGIRGLNATVSFYKHYAEVIIDSPLFQTEGIIMNASFLSDYNGSIKLSWMGKVIYVPVLLRELDNVLYHRVQFTIVNWKNSSYNFRRNAESRMENAMSMLLGSKVSVCKLSPDLELKAAFVSDKFDKNFVIEFCTPIIEESMSLHNGNRSITWQEYLETASEAFTRNDCQKIKNVLVRSFNSYDWIGPPCFIDNVPDSELNNNIIYLKPNGIIHYHLLLDLMKYDSFIPSRVLMVYPSDDNIRYFYKDAHKYTYGQHWYQYLKGMPMMMIEFRTNKTLEEMAKIKTIFRNKSGINWTLNVCHMAINLTELEEFYNFFNKHF